MLTAFFSPTGTTQKVVKALTTQLSDAINHEGALKWIDFTARTVREGMNGTKEIRISSDELFILGVPVYAGRVPNILLPYLNCLKGERTRAIIVVVYGNRHYDDALMELWQLLSNNGFDVIAACAFIGAHAFSDILAAGRPDDDDLVFCKHFAQQIAQKLNQSDANLHEVPIIPGNWPLRSYYKPVDASGTTFDFKRIVPITLATCVNCGHCAEICPVQSISHTDSQTIVGPCIKCCACVKQCPTQSKQFNDVNFIKHKMELEVDFSCRRNPECFL